MFRARDVSLMRVGILGGAGFIGTSLTDQLDKRGNEYTVYDISTTGGENNIVHCDVENPESFKKFVGNDVIVNLAAVHRDNIRPLTRYDDVNVEGAVNVCALARRQRINKIIFTSSVAIYGFAPPNTDESGEPSYFNDYGRTKYLAEEVYKKWQAEDPDRRTLVIVRPTVIFGEGNRGNVYNLLKQISSRKFVMFGDGKNKKSMAYVENIAAFIGYSLSFEPGLHIYNYIDKPDLDMNTLVSETRKILFGKSGVGLRFPAFLGVAIGYIADAISEISRKTLPVSRIRVKKFMSTSQFSSSVSDTGFVPPVSLKEGLERTLRYEFIENNSSERTFDAE